MEARNSSFGRCKEMIIVTVTALLVSTLLCGPALADDLPSLRQGLWEFQRTVGGKKIETTKCTSPTEDMKKMNARLEKSGCRFSPLQKSGNVYTYTADCSMKMPTGATMSSRSTSVMTVAGEGSYKIEIVVVTDGQASKELLVAQRVGDCTR
jgi:Protein of unknown function (DUF3617)